MDSTLAGALGREILECESVKLLPSDSNPSFSESELMN